MFLYDFLYYNFIGNILFGLTLVIYFKKYNNFYFYKNKEYIEENKYFDTIAEYENDILNYKDTIKILTNLNEKYKQEILETKNNTEELSYKVNNIIKENSSLEEFTENYIDNLINTNKKIKDRILVKNNIIQNVKDKLIDYNIDRYSIINLINNLDKND